jgi:hypothetical protein
MFIEILPDGIPRFKFIDVDVWTKVVFYLKKIKGKRWKNGRNFRR